MILQVIILGLLYLACIRVCKGRCDLTRLDIRSHGASDQFSQYFRGRNAVLLEGLVGDSWLGRTWSIDKWRTVLGDTPLPWRRQSTVAANGGAHSAQEFVGEKMFNTSSVRQAVGVADAPVVFSTSAKDVAVKQLRDLGVIRTPRLFEQIQLHPVLSIGGVDEGLPFHQHEEAWLALLHGAKQWFLRRPEARPRAGNLRVLAEDLQEESGTLVCEQIAGEVLYFPDLWWHSTYNLHHQSSNMTIGVGGLGRSNGIAKMLVDGNVTGLRSLVELDGHVLQQVKEKGGFSAAKWGHISILEWLRSYGVQLHSQIDESGEALVHTAAGSGHVAVMSWLLTNRADVHVKESTRKNERAELQKQPIHVAAQNGHMQLISWLAEHGADLNAKQLDGLMPFGQACGSGHVDVASWFFDKSFPRKPKGQSASVLAAASGGHVGVLELLASRKAELTHKKKTKLGPSHVASAHGHARVISWLFERRVAMDLRDADGVEPLHLGVQHGHIDVVAELLKQGSNANAKDASGAAVLHWASYAGHVDAQKLLLTYRADPSARDDFQQFPIHSAAMGGHVAALSELVGIEKVELALDANSEALADIAAEASHLSVLGWLDARVAMPLDAKQAAGYGHKAVVDWLRRRGRLARDQHEL